MRLLLVVFVMTAPDAWARGPCREPTVGWRVLRRLELVPLGEGPGLRVLDADQAWGSRIAVAAVQAVAADYREQFPGAPPLWVHDISRRQGGRIPDHCSHQRGDDVDLRLVVRDPEAGYVDATPHTLHVERTWYLLLRLARTCDVEMIFLDWELQRALYRFGRRAGVSRQVLGYLLQYPYRRASGLVRHRAHHANHIHVRFRRQGVPLDLHGARRLCGLDGGGVSPVRELLRRIALAPEDASAAPHWLRAPLP